MTAPHELESRDVGYSLVTGAHVWRWRKDSDVVIESRHGGHRLLTIQRADLAEVAAFLARCTEADR